MTADRKPESAMLQLPRFDLDDFMVHRMRRPEAVPSLPGLSERTPRRKISPVKTHGYEVNRESISLTQAKHPKAWPREDPGLICNTKNPWKCTVPAQGIA